MASTAKTTRSAAENRLADAASALRLAIEVGTQNVKLKTVRALLDHLTAILPLSSGGLCGPLALDYARSIRVVLSYQPHVEHLSRDDWERTAAFCIDIIKNATTDLSDDDAVSGAEAVSTASTLHGSSYKSSHSQTHSQSARSRFRQVSEEMVSSLSLLTAAPNAPTNTQAADLVWCLIRFLRANATAGKAHSDAFAAINHILASTRTEDIGLTLKVTRHLVRLARHFCSSKSPTLNDKVLITLLFLRPYVTHLAQQKDATSLLAEIRGLLGSLKAEYSSRKDSSLLYLHDMRLTLEPAQPDDVSRVGTPLFTLRCAAKAENAWTAVDMLASLTALTLAEADDRHSSDDEDVESGAQQRPRKRQRMTDELSDLLSSIAHDSGRPRLCALQTVAFLAQHMRFSTSQMVKTIDQLSASCTDDNGTVSSWALLGLASCASQKVAKDDMLSLRWATVWPLAIRSMSNALTCRAACHLLSVLVQLRLVATTSMTELADIISTSMDLSGPAVLADSVLCLLRLVLHSAQQFNPEATIGLTDSVLGWLTRTFTPSRFDDKATVTGAQPYHSDDLAQLVAACLNQGSTSATYQFPLWSDVAQAWVICAEQHDLVAYLLLLPLEDAVLCDDITRQPQRTASTALARVSCEAQVLNHLAAELHKAHDVWSELKHDRPGQISVEMFSFLCHACCSICSIAHCYTYRDARRLAAVQKQLSLLLGAVCSFASSTLR